MPRRSTGVPPWLISKTLREAGSLRFFKPSSSSAARVRIGSNRLAVSGGASCVSAIASACESARAGRAPTGRGERQRSRQERVPVLPPTLNGRPQWVPPA